MNVTSNVPANNKLETELKGFQKGLQAHLLGLCLQTFLEPLQLCLQAGRQPSGTPPSGMISLLQVAFSCVAI